MRGVSAEDFDMWLSSAQVGDRLEYFYGPTTSMPAVGNAPRGTVRIAVAQAAWGAAVAGKVALFQGPTDPATGNKSYLAQRVSPEFGKRFCPEAKLGVRGR